MASKLVFDRGKDSESVASIGEAQLDALVRAVSGDTAHKALRTVVSALVADLRSKEKALREADEEHRRELGDDDKPRQSRDEATAEVRERLVELRSVLLALYGPTVLKEAGFKGDTPVDPEEIERVAGEVHDNLESMKLPKARLGVTKIDRASALSVINAKRKVLRGALKDVAREAREAKVTLAKKNRAIDAFDRAFQGTSLVLEGLLILAGEDELASSVHPKRGGSSAAQDDENEDEGGESGEGGAKDAPEGPAKPTDGKK